MPRPDPAESPPRLSPASASGEGVPAEAPPISRPSRRAFLGGLGLAGAVGATGVLAEETKKTGADRLDRDDIARAEHLADLEFDDAEREMMLEDLEGLREDYRRLREVPLDNAVVPALVFAPLLLDPPLRRADEPTPPPSAGRRSEPSAGITAGTSAEAAAETHPPIEDDENLAFAPIHRLAELLRDGGLTSVRLTELFLDRLAQFDPSLQCVVTTTAERALEAAETADRELAEGMDRGPLHGIPWGAKDLLAVRGYPTTWGALPYREQRLDADAAVVENLDAAGAVLVAKLTLGALAWGDVWFGGTTRNPWNLEQGSSGSSAGSAAATAAGLVGFTIGSETLGSIVSPCTRCGTTGLRPTFGRVSRHGAMALSWSMDKLGPIARDVEDCALVFEHLAGADPRDPASTGGPFRFDRDLDPTELRIGVVRSAFEEERDDAEWRAHDLAVLDVLENLGLDLVDLELPTEELPVDALGLILSVEAAAAFDELTRSGRDAELVRQEKRAWPNVFRQARLVPAVEYVQANRVRTLLVTKMAAALADIDVYVCPSYGAGNLVATNLTGHPAVVVPNGFRADGTPTSITFTGRLFGENELLAVARAYQQATDHHLRRPSLEPATPPPRLRRDESAG